MQYLTRPDVERDTALLEQRDVIQLTRSTHCSSIPFIIYIDKEDKSHFHTFRLLLFSSFKGNNNVLQHNSTLKTLHINTYSVYDETYIYLVVFCVTLIITNLMCQCVLIDKTGETTTVVLFLVCGASFADGIQNIAVLAIFLLFLIEILLKLPETHFV